MTSPVRYAPEVFIVRHAEAVALVEQRLADAESEPWPEWTKVLLTDVLERLGQHKPVTLPNGQGILRCDGHVPPGVPAHLRTLVDYPPFPCTDTARTFDALLEPLPEPEPEPVVERTGPPPQTWSSSR